ncbi:ion channel [Blastococcus colisei]|uniref:Ion channel n=1 Tax=Blastococcus colisei TaxID=1564162 RepID=A0A543PAP8_9ACTN|nr:ion channel [Blastococcus colisei]TQN41152.1 ion channel [Blastococcus colisei]
MRVIRFVRDTPCATLLGAQILGVLLYPFLEDSVAGGALLAIFGFLVLGLVVIAVRATPMLSWVVLLVAAPATVLLVAQVFVSSPGLNAWSSGFEAVLYFYAAASMLAYMLADEVVTTDELFAISAVFTLLAWAFAHTFVVVQALDPGSFIAAVAPNEPRSWTELLFLSFSTLSGTGLSDIVPVKDHARSVVMLEQLAGLFYIAMVVARLVGLSAGRIRRGLK